MNKTIVSVIALLLIASGLFSQETVQWRGDNRDGKYTDTGLLKEWPAEGPKLLWHYDKLGDGHASAAVTDDKIITCGVEDNNGFVIALDQKGNKLWQTTYGKEWMDSWNGVRSTPLISQGKAYIVSGYGVVACINIADGSMIWTIDAMEKYQGRNIKWGFTENLLIDGDKLFLTLGGEEHNVIALDKNKGTLIWSCKGKGEKSSYCSPMLIKLESRKILVTVTETSILGIDISNGELLWSYKDPNKWSVHANTPLYYQGYIFNVSGYGEGGTMLKLAADGSSVTKVWTDSILDNRIGGFVLLDGKIYASGDAAKKWLCMDWATGKELFSSNVFGTGVIIYADGLFYCYSDKGEMGLLKAEKDGFKLISSFKIPFGKNQHWAHPVIHNKKLYVRHGTSLMVYSIAAE